ncbi:MAG: heat-inducible transcription repressor HrcA [Calditrichaeota bacterium]|nr:heat-inducible transcription repressor HrcA [Calditrichota bacterium]MCB0269070.1 heat-inducible transcription repressor HrcA [Calditrichota bacterium]MCB0285864.1 heat-inducible transcription repressor HrcA [Calditrichota bacterium]MCB0300062.1 heat-inducible transcription repressor HrcA [Calditrichota bacterium]MCB9069483.1 heat-inducible transcription repressor HrcA [Calditrichia bacterium]
MVLSTKEKLVLGELVKNFIDTATPVSSSLIAQTSRLNISPATIRNIMAMLESRGYIYQPHTSAGRVPQTPAYRAYVDMLMKKSRLSFDEKEQITVTINPLENYDLEDVLNEVTRILAHLSKQIGIMMSPRIEQGIFERMELIPLSSEKLLVIITVKSGFVRTITLEISQLVSPDKLNLVSQILNERLQGMKISDIKRTFSAVVKDIQHEDTGLVRMFSQRVDRLFNFSEDIDLYFKGTQNILQSPDFQDVSTLTSVMEMLETRRELVKILAEADNEQPTSIKIGEEIDEQKMAACSIITARYQIGDVSGVVGIIGPKRMNYSKFLSIVEFTARKISEIYGKN